MKRKLEYPTPAEEAAIQRGITQDPDNPELTDEWFAEARPASEVMPPELYAELTKRHRGPGKKPKKVLLTMRLDRDIVERLRASGRGWQTRANDALRKALSE
jgi:uncharacterized protein (DUF4415 family)